MGLMDMLKGLAGGKKSGGGASGGSGGGSGNVLLDQLMGMVSGGGGGGAGGLGALLGSVGGLGGLLAKFNQAGLGDKVQSWVGTGANQPLSGAEVQQALGAETIDKLAADTNLSPPEVSNQLAGLLPGVVDQVSPGGQLPGGDDLLQAVRGLDLGKLGGS